MEKISVVKRDNSIVDFDRSKIELAIKKANKNVQDKIDDILIEYIAKKIENDISADTIAVEDIQDMVEDELVSIGKYKLAKEYILYRYNRGLERDKEVSIINAFKEKVNAKNVENSNANVDEKSFSGREKEASSAISKTYAIHYNGLSKKTAKAHDDMLIYQHDLEKAVLGEHNCLNVDFDEVFSHGFRTRNGSVRKPGSFSTACQLMAVTFQCQSQVC